MLFIEQLAQNPAWFAAWVTVVAFSVCLHETAHAWAAWQQGDDTAVRGGYGDLDPRKLMGWSSLLALVLVGIAWGAVPVVPSRLRRSWSYAWVSAAGPATNLALAVVCAFGWVMVKRLAPSAAPLTLVLSCGIQANCLLGVLNLLPLPPFDGWGIASGFFPTLQRVSTDGMNVVSWVMITVLLFTPARGIIDGVAFAIADQLTATARAVIG